MKAIAYVIPSFPVLTETFVVNEMNAMAELGHRILPIALESAAAIDSSLHQPWLARVVPPAQLGPKVTLAMTLATLTPPVWKFVFAQQAFPRRSLLLLAARVAARARGCDHLHAHFAQHTAAVAIVAARILGVTVSFVGHGADVYANPHDLAVKLRTADLAVAVCREMRQLFEQQGACQAALIPCGINTRLFTPGDRQRTSKRLLFIGRLVEKKGLDTLLQALARIDDPELGLDIVGDGPLADRYRTQIEALGLQSVRFLGVRNQDWLAQHGHGYLALVAPFRIAANGDRDTGPLVVKEAMAMGLPVITSNIMGLKEIVSRRTGFQVAPDCPVALGRAIRKLAGFSENRYRRMALQAKWRARRLFDVELQARRLSGWMESLG
ncbi:Glycosyltransferase involved in cell wall bisynthesis [Ferrimonas sediminum]|uniref:Glycosyltransferase involved in cell wall bisynthesis n=1 Tax=Ferrimonas sediminum TaxID=718193 RepID=A0A1G8S5T1_9GAMM|nr:glycosyltransferase family 4 protein [Ferrimonas sediminum]SDJ24541.1 Glycosyltransferase involved in cell wall bisynthesis [Ferrimonas sediminum]